MKYEFKAEVKQVLDIVVHSLYTDKEIFLRELLSNASDASEKLRYKLLKNEDVFGKDAELRINVSVDEAQNQICVEDFGIGMTKDELLENLGTIAHSGSKAFMKAVKDSGGKLNEELIGQFGVGFYSVFMVADNVVVETRSFDPNSEALKWTCTGDSEFTIEPSERQARGTKITLHLKKEFSEFSQKFRVEGIINKYSNFVEFPIYLGEEKLETMQAIWLKNKSEVKPEEYEAFFKFHDHAVEAPLDYLHFNADVPIVLNALLYVPSINQERLGFGKMKSSVSLYSKKILIDAAPKDLLPDWMRFLKGVIDSADIPLNISRESMQDTALVKKIGKIVVKRFLKHLLDLSKKDSEKFSKFLKNFGLFIKEGATVDFEFKEDLIKLLRFESSSFKTDELVSLADYVSRMPESQKDIFYAIGSSREAIEEAPYVEAFKSRGVEVLYLCDHIDSIMLNSVREFDGKKFVSVDSANATLPEAPELAGEALSDDESKALCDWIKTSLNLERINEVCVSKRLGDTPAAVLNSDDLDPAMRNIMRLMNPENKLPDVKVNFEINAKAKLIKNLNALRNQDEALAQLVLAQLFDNALLAAGLHENPRKMAKRLNELLEKIKI